MDADLDLLLIAVYVTADDLLPEKPKNAKRSVTDAEVVTLCVAQAIMGIPSDRRFLRTARKQLRHLFPVLPGQAGYFKRRRRLTDALEWLMNVFASQSPGFYDDLLLVDSTPVGCARSRETVKRSALSDAADYGYCRSHSRFFWGFRLHGIFAPDGTPRAVTVASPKRDERDVALELLARTRRRGGETLIGDKGYAGRAFAQAVSDQNATILRPRRKDEPGRGPHLALNRSGNLGGDFYGLLNCSRVCSNSAGGSPSQAPCSRRWLYQSTHSSVASSTWSIVFQGPRRLISSVL